MDKQQAKFILQSFRPDGADATDADFADALRLAAQDRELGDWLARERASDAAFATALSEVKIPDDLKGHIMAMSGENVTSQMEWDESLDEVFFSALHELRPPEGLRDEILTAMQIEQEQGGRTAETITEHNGPVWLRKWTRVAAVAAVVFIGGFLAYHMTTPSLSKDGIFKVSEVQYHAGSFLNAGFEFDLNNEDPRYINRWLNDHQLPSANTIPAGLQKLRSLGCKQMSLPGAKKASIICFLEGSGGNIYLVVAKNHDLRGERLPSVSEVTTKDCYHCKATKWNAARWRDAQYTYILLKKKESAGKNELIAYF